MTTDNDDTTTTITTSSNNNNSSHQNNHNDSTTSIVPSLSIIQQTNWDGYIPIIVTLASTSISSHNIPKPIHVLLSRNTYIHIGLMNVINKLQSHALILSPSSLSSANSTTTKMIQVSEPVPGISTTTNDSNDHATQQQRSNDNDTTTTTTTNSKNNNNFPLCWFEDETTNTPLRWQFFVGILYDMMHPNLNNNNNDQNETNHNTSTTSIPIKPWKIKLHFTNYPNSIILPFDYPNNCYYTIQMIYKHSLKQAITILYNQSKNAMNITKESHLLLWDSIINNNYTLFHTIDMKINPIYTKQQQPNDEVKDDTNEQQQQETQQQQSVLIHAIPIRVLLNTTNPPIQRKVEYKYAINHTLGQLLHDWLPQHFLQVSTTTATPPPPRTTTTMTTNTDDASSSNISTTSIKRKDNTTDSYILPNSETVQYWKVCGIVPPLSINIYELWKHCSHPDQFLYIIIKTR